ncbi:signal transduction histidine kinase [Kribbella sp. VKM Ac-2527]|uniref:histidine kinase n=1 Tax=Kribbella caucasensis TaxID=2512215 RepID=A0A4V3CA08_9ACTN|nr:sensor histidine kinase [Kribbella sp. VKM Ac-2527]TDO48396.1 signal transduction histidine kinase [Kribbella sp. VKM Ac-2527]
MTIGDGARVQRQDLAVAAGAVVLVLAGTLLQTPSRHPLDLVGYLIPLSTALALVVRRVWPVPVLVVAAAGLLLYPLIGYPGVTPAFPLLVALYTSVDAGYRKTTLLVSTTALSGSLGINLALPGAETSREIIQRWALLAGWLISAKILAEVMRHRRGYLREVEQRALDAERTREEAALRRAGEERLRIARDLHDSLTHNISVIKVHAGVAVHLAQKRGEAVPEALLAIQEASREAMRELRSTLEVLRADSTDTCNGLARLPELVDRARSAGVPATVEISGPPRPLPPDVDQAAYRIVQEALTNVTRHAGSASAAVHIRYDESAVTVQIDDDGHATPDAVPVPGVGLTGMQERVTALGGRLRAAPRPDGGFTVRAELPVELPT